MYVRGYVCAGIKPEGGKATMLQVTQIQSKTTKQKVGLFRGIPLIKIPADVRWENICMYVPFNYRFSGKKKLTSSRRLSYFHCGRLGW